MIGPESASRGMEREKLRQGIAAELRTPEQGSYFKKLRSIMGALILSGLVVFSPGTARSMETGVTQERMNVNRILETKEKSPEDIELLYKIVQQLREKGGIQETHGSERLYKPDRLSLSARTYADELIEDDKVPYYLKPENIFGKNFIDNNPEKAKEWFQKIEPVVKATAGVMIIEGDEVKTPSSGVVIATKNGTRILTNEHVISKSGEGKAIKVELFGGGKAICEVVARDPAKDLALLKIIHPIGSQEKLDKSLQIIKPLEIANQDTPIKKGDTLAGVGFPAGFPRETSFEKVKKIGECHYSERGINRKFSYISSVPDERFSSLAYFETSSWLERPDFSTFRPKGIGTGGMSGGAMINLDGNGKSGEIMGLYVLGANNMYIEGIGSTFIHAKSINEFLGQAEKSAQLPKP